MKHILQLGFGTQGLRYIEESKKNGYIVSAADLEKFFKWESSKETVNKIDNPLYFDNFSEESFMNIINKANNFLKLDGIIPLADTQVVISSVFSELFNLKSPGIYAASISTNKYLQRIIFEKNGINIPKFKLLNKNNYHMILKKTTFPKIMKPTNMFGSIGVRLVNNYDEALVYAKNLLEMNESFLMEEFIEGQEFSVESLVQDGNVKFVNITKKYTNSNFVETGHLVPFFGLEDTFKNKIYKMNEKVINNMNVKDSIVHLEAKIHQNDIFVIEVATRTPGDRIMDLIELSTGINIYSKVVDISMGKKIDILQNTKNVTFYAHWFTTDKIGTINSFDGEDVIKNDNNIKMFELLKSKGDKLEGESSSFNRLGYCIVQIKNENELSYYQKNLDKILNVRVTGKRED
ncbi:ATP-grasp domain-containing protein [Staphylococcus pseudintermedius]|uniref:ATP-grasp domain-containing protein n=1 Tax=Staphylococcus pseudintermedius TaxID=283734 RepID=UPI002B25C95A|nr:ATP-grasp domain-containing protein [Staphylococcus pseudintermedius]WQL14965.1 ATP-grasp domain-containing protein [Staphylococcus pseudintermedius]